MITLKEFLSDSYGKTFIDVVNDKRINFQVVIDFFNDKARLIRMEDSELHHNRPPLAGVVKEFEGLKSVDNFLSSYDAHTTKRFRQAVGALVHLHMLKRGWKSTVQRGSLGTRKTTKPNTKTPGAYVNKHGLAKWFTSAKRFIK